MKKTRIKRQAAAAIAALLLLVLPSGCVSDEATRVNQVVMAHRISLSDPFSREAAIRTLPFIRERKEDYRVGADDVLSVSIFEWMIHDQMKTVDVRVSEKGFISLPLIGNLEAKCKTVEEIEKAVMKRLDEGGFIKMPRVSVAVKEFRSKTVAVVGAVENPGRFNLRQNVSTLLDVLSQAGGLHERSGYVLYIIRPRCGTAGTPAHVKSLDPDGSETPAGLMEFLCEGEKEVIVIDLVKLLEEGDLELNAVLVDEDVVYVPDAPQFYVMGFVKKPGGFPLKRPINVLQGIALAEGLMEREASPRSCMLKRRNPDGEVLIALDLVAISDGEAANFFLQTNDIIEVRQTGWKWFWLGLYDTFTSMFRVGYNLDYRTFH